jgi:LuxR family maltose regulon positive regulatory protein
MGTSAPPKRRRQARASLTELLPATKFEVPVVREDLVQRPALLAAVCPLDTTRLTLVAAPAGCGKTTLLAQWARRPGTQAVAWLSLDGDDNESLRFCSCMLEAMRRIEPGFGARVEGALVAGADLVEVVAPLLVNELVLLARPTVLVLDDYHLISAPEVHDSLARLLEHLPPRHQLAIAAREDPPLPLPRLRARGQLAEIRATDLSFSDDEARLMLNARLGLSLSGWDVAELRRKTEGWAAGLQLAGLSLRGGAHAGAAIRSFGGDDRQIVDYLGAEVLDGLDEEMRSFLLATSILDAMSGPLCDAVTGQPGGAQRLERLERQNLFLVALDDRRQEYRYHHLFRELLRHELRRTMPERIAALHRAAMVWHRDHGSVDAAVAHAIAAGEPDEAARLIAAAWAETFNRGHLATVTRWLDALPPAAALSDWRLWLARTWAALDGGRLDEAEEWLHAAERGRLELVDPHDAMTAGRWRSLLRSLHRFKSGDVRAAAHELSAIRPAAHPDPFADTVARILAGLVAHWRGDLDAAVPAFELARTAAEADGNGLAELYSLGYLAAIRAAAGDVQETEALLERCRALVAERPATDERFIAMIWHLARGRALRDAGDPAAARAVARRAVELSQRGAGRIERAWSLVELGRTHAALGDAAAADQALAGARWLLADAQDPGRVATMLHRAEREAGPKRSRPRRRVDRGDDLSERELAVLRLLPTEMSQREIGQALYVSLNTVKSHVRSIYAKLSADSRAEAITRARELELL